MFTNQVTEEFIRERSRCQRQFCECQLPKGNVHCPVHGDKVASMSVEDTAERLLVRCHAGCDTLSILEYYRALLPKNRSNFMERQNDPIGLTIKEFATSKNLKVSFLKDNYVKQFKNFNHPALAFEYRDETGGLLATRIRLAMDGSKKFLWKSGSSAKEAGLYGRWRTVEAYEKGYLVICEGESDCLTLWANGCPAIGLPGVSVWNDSLIEEVLADLRIKTVYVFVEPDIGGNTMIRNIKTSSVSNKTRLIFANSFKDFSEMWVANPEKFNANLESHLESSCKWSEYQRIATIIEHVMRENNGKMPSPKSIMTNTSKRGLRYARRN